jgi:hypothetical protein
MNSFSSFSETKFEWKRMETSQDNNGRDPTKGFAEAVAWPSLGTRAGTHARTRALIIGWREMNKITSDELFPILLKSFSRFSQNER